MRVISNAIVLALVFGPHAASAQAPQTQRLTAVELPLSSNPADNVLAEIWKDKLPALAAAREALAAQAPIKPSMNAIAFTARFKDGDAEIILSALATSECKFYDGLGLPPSLQSCPARVATVRNGAVIIVASEPAFTFAIAMTDNDGYDNASTTDKTAITFDPGAHLLTATLTEIGKPGEAGRSIHFNY